MASRMVTRTVIDSKTYNVYTIQNGTNVLLDTVTLHGRPSTKAMRKKYEVDNIALECINEVKATYGVPVKEFMQIAQKLTDNNQ